MPFTLDTCYLNDLVLKVHEEIGVFGKLLCAPIGVRKPPWPKGGWVHSQPPSAGRKKTLLPFSTGNSDGANAATSGQVYSLGNVNIGEPSKREALEILPKHP